MINIIIVGIKIKINNDLFMKYYVFILQIIV